jgi:hypothetical protein
MQEEIADEWDDELVDKIETWDEMLEARDKEEN